AAWLALPVRHRRAVRAGAIALGLGALALLPAVRFDYNPVRLRDPRTESVATFNDLLKDGTSPWTVDVLMPDQQAAAALARRLETLNTVDRAVTLTDYVPQAQDAKRAIIEDIALFMPPPATTQRHKAPTTGQQVAALRAFRARIDALLAAGVEPALAASAQRLRAALERFLTRVRRTGEAAPLVATLEQSLLGSLPKQLRLLRAALHPGRVTVADLPADLRQRMVAPDGRVRVQVFARHNLADNAALARFVDSVRGVTPKATGSAVNVVAAARVVVRAVRSALLIALALIGTLLWVLWRRLDDTVVVLIPLVLAGASTAAASVVLGIPFNFANVIVLPFLLGFGVDSGIHLVHRQRTGLRAGENLLETSTARAVFFSALTTIASFGSLGLSPHRGMASLGHMLTIGVCLTLVCTLVVLPALGRSASAKPAGKAMETNHEDATERDKMSSVA
ncbi:MAG: MMPL family transporter, partial [Candidatus Binatia bacterium]